MHVRENWIIIATAESHPVLTMGQALCWEPYMEFHIWSSQQFNATGNCMVPILGTRKLRFRPNIIQLINGKIKTHTRSVGYNLFFQQFMYWFLTLCQTQWVLRKTDRPNAWLHGTRSCSWSSCFSPHFATSLGQPVGVNHFQCFSIYISFFAITSLNKLNYFWAKSLWALPDCTVFDSAWLVKYLAYQASDESWFCLCSNQWCISARKFKKERHLKFE